MKTFERRMAVTELELREDSSGPTLTGYASTFNQPYDMGWYSESVDPAAFKTTLGRKPDVRLLINHDGLPLARTTSGTLTLDTDKHGLLASAQLDPSDPDVAALVPKMRRGDLNQMSFGFRTTEDEWSPDMSKRVLRSLDLNNGDVSVVTYPANPNASVGLRAGGTPFEAMSSAIRSMEARNAPEAEVLDLLARMQRAYSGDFSKITESVANASELMAVRIGAELEETLAASKTPYGDVDYADPGYQSDGKKRYPIDTEEHAKAAWSFINQSANDTVYTAEQLSEVKDKIMAALKKFGVDVDESKNADLVDLELRRLALQLI